MNLTANEIVKPNVTLAGNSIERDSFMCGSVSLFESVYLRQFNGNFTRMSPSTSYLAYWVDEEKMCFVSYCEGSVSYIQCEDSIRFDMEMVSIESFLQSEI